MARVGDGAQMAGVINDTSRNILAWKLARDRQKQQELENQLRKDMMYADNKRWVEKDTYQREQDGIRQGRDDERFRYQQQQDAYKMQQDQLESDLRRDAEARKGMSEDARFNAEMDYKYDALKRDLSGRNIMPEAFSIDANGKKYTGLRNPQTGAYDLDRPEKKPTVAITVKTPDGGSIRRNITQEEYDQMGRDKSQADYIESRLKADPKDIGALMRQKRRNEQGAFVPPENAAIRPQAGDRITVEDASGKRFTVPAAQLDAAKAKGYKQVE